MTMRKEIKMRLDKEPKYRELLFKRGYLITTSKNISENEFPFYGMWEKNVFGNYFIYVHKEQTFYYYTKNEISVVLVGHAYNPFLMECDENQICKNLLDAYLKSREEYFDLISELTGLFVVAVFDGNQLVVCQDACALTSCYFGEFNSSIFIAEHAQLIADILNLKMNSKVEKLVNSKCYNIGNRYLPGNITPYDGIKRLGGNTYLVLNDSKFNIKRFYPIKELKMLTEESEKQEAVKKIGELIHNGIECCVKKWNNRAISLSGGTDSKTTLACANGLYEKFKYFSFSSKPQESVDADGARKICDALGLEHTFYQIPQTNEEIDDFDFLKMLLNHNTSYFVNLADNEIRKFVYLYRLNAYDIELKSWASEVARVFFERKYKIKMPERINERHCSIFQTRYFGHPILLKWSDKEYYNFLKEIELDKTQFNFEHADLIYWEIRMGSWGASVTSAQQLFHRVTMPMNNRKILELFLSMPHDERKSDLVHKKVINIMNSNIEKADVEIKNLYFHSYRIWLEKIYFYFRTLFYLPKKH